MKMKTTVSFEPSALLKFGSIVIMIAVLLILGLRIPLFFRLENLMDVLKQGSILALVALAFHVVLVAGGFDMCGGATLNLFTNLTAWMILSLGINAMYSIPVGIFLGLLIGCMNAFFVAGMRLPNFVGTLGSMYIVQGLTAMVNQGATLTIRNQGLFSTLGGGYILDLLPVLFIIMIFIGVILHYFLKHTKTGLRCCACGINPVAAEMRGVNPRKYLALGYIISGALLGFVGVMRCSYSNGASALNVTFEYLVKAIICCYLGSTMSKNGEMNVLGTIISALFIGALSNALILNSITDQVINGMLGIVLILSILVKVIKKREIGQVTLF